MTRARLRHAARTAALTATALVAIGATGALVAGCGSNKLETGYRVRALKASKAEQRAFYAGPFSPEARAAQIDSYRNEESRRRRPGE